MWPFLPCAVDNLIRDSDPRVIEEKRHLWFSAVTQLEPIIPQLSCFYMASNKVGFGKQLIVDKSNPKD